MNLKNFKKHINQTIVERGYDYYIDDNVIEILKDLEKEELINIILDFTSRDRRLRESILLEYSKVSDEEELKKCKKLIDSIVNKYENRSGYIYYTEIYKFINDMGATCC